MAKRQRYLILFTLLVYIGLFLWSLIRVYGLPTNGSLEALLPQDNVYVKSMQRLSELQTAEGFHELFIESPDSALTLELAKTLKMVLESNVEYFGLRDVELENDLYKIRPYLPYLLRTEELDEIRSWVEEYIHRKQLEINPLYVEFQEDTATPQAQPDQLIDSFRKSSLLLDEALSADRYYRSPDGRQLRMIVFPNHPPTDYEASRRNVERIRALCDSLAYSNEVSIILGGYYQSQLSKVQRIEAVLKQALWVGIIALLIFLGMYLRHLHKENSAIELLAHIASIFLILLSSFTIALAIQSFFFEELLLFALIVFGVLFGINLDYILHVYALCSEQKGSSRRQLLKSASFRTIVYSATTTALAVSSLALSNFSGFQQLGLIFVLTVGVNLFATWFFIPLIVGNSAAKASFAYMDDVVKALQTSYARLLVALAFVSLLIYSLLFSLTPDFTFGFSSLEPKDQQNPEKLFYQTKAKSALKRNDPVYYITDDFDQLRDLDEELHRGMIDGAYPIAGKESIALRFPTSAEQLLAKQQRVDTLKRILSKYGNSISKPTLMGLTLFELMDQAQIPDQVNKMPSWLLNRFADSNGNLVPVMLAFPSYTLSSGDRSISFRKTMGNIQYGEGDLATGAATFLVASSILEDLISQQKSLMLFPAVVIFLLIILFFRSVQAFLYIMIPALTAAWLLFVSIKVLGIELHVFNLVVFPIFIGIVTDNSMHFAESLNHYGSGFFPHFMRKKMPVLSACTISSMLGFAGLVTVNHPGLESMGWLALLAIFIDLFALLLVAVGMDAFYRWRGSLRN